MGDLEPGGEPLADPQPRSMPERGPAGVAADRGQLGDERLGLERVVERVQGPDGGLVEQPLSLAFPETCRSAVIRPSEWTTASSGWPAEVSGRSWKITKTLRSTTSLSLKASSLPTIFRGGREPRQGPGTGRNVEIPLLDRVAVGAVHRVGRPEVGRHVARVFPLGGGDGAFPENEPHSGQVPKRRAVEQPASVRQSVQFEPDVLRVANLVVGALVNVGNDPGRVVGRAEDELELEREPPPAARSGGIPERSRQATASSILCGSSSVRFIAIRNVRTVALGERKRGSTAVPDRVPAPPFVPASGFASWATQIRGQLPRIVPRRTSSSYRGLMTCAPGRSGRVFAERSLISPA